MDISTDMASLSYKLIKLCVAYSEFNLGMYFHSFLHIHACL